MPISPNRMAIALMHSNAVGSLGSIAKTCRQICSASAQRPSCKCWWASASASGMVAIGYPILPHAAEDCGEVVSETTAIAQWRSRHSRAQVGAQLGQPFGVAGQRHRDFDVLIKIMRDRFDISHVGK